ncbi:hypothetical protein AMATHDRAFT_65594 [Amanita thiersii Skay4041]|uniref:Uncharacterized protein n=1 Tax=Amanita thiersii Skay4041 TaxID=703135 RepID=A0A2A9NGC3_9AGAR|nr:hypothetical protein AMATHDRAFT_65594 [Amanita thiersii Skay4041]
MKATQISASPASSSSCGPHAQVQPKPKSSPHLSTLGEWAEKHITSIFEADTDEEALRAIEETFSRNVTGSLNGVPINNRKEVEMLVLTLRGGKGSLKVSWKYGLSAPADPATNRDGAFGDVYVIHNVKRALPGSQTLAMFDRHKVGTVKIESTSSDPNVDSRRITKLVLVALDERVDDLAKL